MTPHLGLVCLFNPAIIPCPVDIYGDDMEMKARTRAVVVQTDGYSILLYVPKLGALTSWGANHVGTGRTESWRPTKYKPPKLPDNIKLQLVNFAIEEATREGS